MKTVKPVFAILFLISSITATAQGKQNDATWDETVQFLAENIQKFDVKVKTSYAPLNSDSEKFDNYAFLISNKLLTRTTNSDEMRLTASLEDLEAISINSNEGGCFSLRLRFTKNSVNNTFHDSGEKHESSIGHIDILLYDERELFRNSDNDIDTRCTNHKWDENDEFVQRMLKAFKHLAYLANEKRSNSKF